MSKQRIAASWSKEEEGIYRRSIHRDAGEARRSITGKVTRRVKVMKEKRRTTYSVLRPGAVKEPSGRVACWQLRLP